MAVIIGLLGEKRAGKGTFVKLLKEIAQPKIIGVVRSVDILFETLKIWKIEPTRSNLQNLVRAMEEKYGQGTLTQAVYGRIINDSSEVVVFDGVRLETDLVLIRKFEKNFLVYVTASPRTRWERSKTASEKAGENFASLEQFMDEEKAYTEQFISKIGAAADFKIINEGTIEDYRKEVKRFYDALLPSLT